MTERIRTTISLSPEVHDIFRRMAEVAGMSVSRCMGDWLADTAEGAQFVATKMAEARSAPKTVMREMQAYVHGLREEVDTLIDQQRAKARAATAAAPPAGRAPSPPASNTGGKVPSKTGGKARRGPR